MSLVTIHQILANVSRAGRLNGSAGSLPSLLRDSYWNLASFLMESSIMDSLGTFPEEEREEEEEEGEKEAIWLKSEMRFSSCWLKCRVLFRINKLTMCHSSAIFIMSSGPNFVRRRARYQLLGREKERKREGELSHVLMLENCGTNRIRGESPAPSNWIRSIQVFQFDKSADSCSRCMAGGIAGVSRKREKVIESFCGWMMLWVWRSRSTGKSHRSRRRHRRHRRRHRRRCRRHRWGPLHAGSECRRLF